MKKPLVALMMLAVLVLSGRALAQMMGGGHMGMMGGYGLNIPSISPDRLPEADSGAARLYVFYCSQCHVLPNPSMHTAAEWPQVADRMFYRMYGMYRRGMMMMGVALPSPEERMEIVGYLQAHAFKPLPPAKVPAPDTQGAKLFRDACSRCHGLPDPSSHTARQWPAIMKRMLAYMESSGMKPPSEQQSKEILGYLEGQAAR
jgi:mono/diheme cytochrome c family protein